MRSFRTFAQRLRSLSSQQPETDHRVQQALLELEAELREASPDTRVSRCWYRDCPCSRPAFFDINYTGPRSRHRRFLNGIIQPVGAAIGTRRLATLCPIHGVEIGPTLGPAIDDGRRCPSTTTCHQIVKANGTIASDWLSFDTATSSIIGNITIAIDTILFSIFSAAFVLPRGRRMQLLVGISDGRIGHYSMSSIMVCAVVIINMFIAAPAVQALVQEDVELLKLASQQGDFGTIVGSGATDQ